MLGDQAQACSEQLPVDTRNRVDTMYLPDSTIINFYDLYSVESQRLTAPNIGLLESKPFVHHLALHSPTGEIVRVKGLFDDGAMISVMSTDLWTIVKHRLGPAQPSTCKLRMADGFIVPSEGSWTGTVHLGGTHTRGAFEIFPSGGAWSFLVGKLLLQAFHAIHNYDSDTLLIPTSSGQCTLQNQLGQTPDTTALAAAGLSLALDIKVYSSIIVDTISSSSIESSAELTQIVDCPPCTNQTKPDHITLPDSTSAFVITATEPIANPSLPPQLQPNVHRRTYVEEVEDEDAQPLPQYHMNAHIPPVPTSKPIPEAANTHHQGAEPTTHALRRTRQIRWPALFVAGRRYARKRRHIWYKHTLRNSTPTTATTTAAPLNDDNLWYIGPDAPLPDPTEDAEFSINHISSQAPSLPFTRLTDPFNPQRISAILDAVTIGADLTNTQLSEVNNLLTEFADCFALSVSEVTPVEGAIHRLNIPDDATFSRRIHQRPLTRRNANTSMGRLMTSLQPA
ncbi:hypothetical protein A0H81_13345 [Grifola frondosa]|uniref:Uncharacterized protein n=1 Tax=Grifola frondosa TaxID=5627 RepID=A0A1C7LQH8_GRIFR|nr:hypothetical protein A0H81_13345 [Grifola frondosa]